MKQQASLQLCEVHKINPIAIDLNPKCDPQQRHLCLECCKNLTGKNNSIFQYEATPKLFSYLKKELKSSKEAQNKKNQEMLNEILQIVIELGKVLEQLKNDINKSMDAIQGTQQWIDELDNIEIQSYFDIMENFEKSEIECCQSLQKLPNTLVTAEKHLHKLKKNIFFIDKKVIAQTTLLQKNINELNVQKCLDQWRERIGIIDSHLQTRYAFIQYKITKRAEQIDNSFEQIQIKFQESLPQFLQELQDLSLEKFIEISDVECKSDQQQQLPQYQYLNKWMDQIEDTFYYSLCKLKDQDRQKQNSKKISIQKSVIKIQHTSNVNYKEIPQTTIEKCSHCQAIALNQTMMLVACENNILFYNFQQGKLSFKKKLILDTTGVTCLYFFKTENRFIAGCIDNQIMIWSINHNQEWFCEQILKAAHSNQINQIIVNKNESLMISCSEDGFIKFWNYSNKWGLFQIIKDQNDLIQCLSLNFSEELLASCGSYFPKSKLKWSKNILGSISIYKKENQFWQCSSTIPFEESIHKLCFTENDILVYQLMNSSSITILKLHETGKNQKTLGNIDINENNDVSQFFPTIFNRYKSVLIHKQGKKVRIFKSDKNGLFKKDENFIEFQTQVVEGTLSDNGNYLILWDNITELFQVLEQH